MNNQRTRRINLVWLSDDSKTVFQGYCFVVMDKKANLETRKVKFLAPLKWGVNAGDMSGRLTYQSESCVNLNKRMGDARSG